MRLWTPLQPRVARIRQLIEDEVGATAVEYGLIVALISIAIISALSVTGNEISTTFGIVGTTLSGSNTIS